MLLERDRELSALRALVTAAAHGDAAAVARSTAVLGDAAARRELEAVSDPGDASQAARYRLDGRAGQLLAEERLGQREQARLELAKALAVLRAGRRPAEARDLLRQALELDADALATQVRQELCAAGGRPRTTALHGPAALTPAGRRVAGRAAAGQANRAIAEALLVTPKTVELHPRNAYGKRGARDRHDPPALPAPTPA